MIGRYCGPPGPPWKDCELTTEPVVVTAELITAKIDCVDTTEPVPVVLTSTVWIVPPKKP